MSTQPPRPTDHLNALLRVELSAVLAYQHAHRSVDGRLGGASPQILDMGTGHQRTAAALQGNIRALGGIPGAEPGSTRKSFVLLHDELSVQQLLKAEESGLADYEAALASLEGGVRDLVEHELLPRQRQHVAALSKILVEICAA